MSKYRSFENFHILLWLLKDVCWVSDFKIAGIIIAVPTIILALYITYLHRQIFSELAHNIAVCCWILANVTWMVGEFYFQDSSRPFAIIFFIAGLSMLLYYYLIYLPFKRR